MLCPFCQADETKVLDSGLVHPGLQVKRRRSCQVCEARFNTFERIEGIMPKIIKRDGQVEAFDEAKLRSGLIRAFKKRPYDQEQFENWVSDIMTNIRSEGGKEVSSIKVGRLAMQKLKEIDAIAYLRFASVYDGFSNIEDFQYLIRQMANEQVPILTTDIEEGTYEGS